MQTLQQGETWVFGHSVNKLVPTLVAHSQPDKPIKFTLHLPGGQVLDLDLVCKHSREADKCLRAMLKGSLEWKVTEKFWTALLHLVRAGQWGIPKDFYGFYSK